MCHGVSQLHSTARILPRPQVGLGVGARPLSFDFCFVSSLPALFTLKFHPALLRGTFARCLALELLAKYFHNASLPWHVDQYIRNISREGLVGRCEPVLDGGGMVGYDSATNRNVPVGQRSCASLPVQIPRMFNTPPHNWQATTAPHGTLAPIASQSLRESQKLFHAVPSLGSQWDASVSTDSVLTNAGKPRHEECKVLMSLFPSLRS
ncbi:hypothetical protein BKA81DRAFT_8062 [Phyllosticta paracitricarpa]|uniref:Uncharacterized protein n=2 Tax=Phyllosticta TaxID=121621 RepID=A0ABR1MK02_9PEZI